MILKPGQRFAAAISRRGINIVELFEKNELSEMWLCKVFPKSGGKPWDEEFYQYRFTEVDNQYNFKYLCNQDKPQ